MELPCGITGFRRVEDPELPVQDLKVFKAYCHAAALAVGGRVVAVDESFRAGANFVMAVLEWPAGSVALLLNAHFPILAFAEPPGNEEVLFRFIDVPELAAVFRGFGAYTLAAAAELAAPLTTEACQHLAQAELKQKKYWRPRCVGEIVFNFWD